MSKRKHKQRKKLEIDKLEELTQNPFASLGARYGIEASPEDAAPVEAGEEELSSDVSLLVRKEKRAKGKLVTAIFHHEGDHKQLLKRLKGLLGAGGSVKDDVIELQGDHVERVKQWLGEQGYRVR